MSYINIKQDRNKKIFDGKKELICIFLFNEVCIFDNKNYM